jgi:hypothetical protein
MKNVRISQLEQPLLDRMSFDDENDSWRVTLVSGGNIEVKADAVEIGRQIKEGLQDIKIDFPENKSEVIKVPEIIKELSIERVEIPVIVKEIEIKEIEKQVIVKELEVREIEKPIIVTEYKTIEIPIIVTKIEDKIVEKLPIWAISLMLIQIAGILGLLIVK